MSDRSEIIEVFGEEVAASVDTPLVVIEGTKGDPGADGVTPHIGANGNWFLGENDTGKPSRGEKGEKGDTGAIGPRGEAGPQGATGKDGTNGKDGVDGKPGAAGADGVTPHIGDNGNWYIGSTDTGDPSRGATGAKGDTGATGPAGPVGPQGPAGAPGKDGAQGEKGDKGDTGTPGKAPVRGTDYWTAADKQEIVNDVLAELPDGTEVSY